MSTKYEGTINPTGIQRFIDTLRKNATDATDRATKLLGDGFHHDTRTKLYERREVYDYIADQLERSIRDERHYQSETFPS